MKGIWEETKAAVKLSIPKHCFRMWIEPLQLIKCTADSIVLSSHNFFFKKR